MTKPFQINPPYIEFHRMTPQLQVMSHFSMKYKNTINSFYKHVLIDEMKEYIKINNLDINYKDVDYMAKFIRSPRRVSK